MSSTIQKIILSFFLGTSANIIIDSFDTLPKVFNVFNDFKELLMTFLSVFPSPIDNILYIVIISAFVYSIISLISKIWELIPGA